MKRKEINDFFKLKREDACERRGDEGRGKM